MTLSRVCTVNQPSSSISDRFEQYLYASIIVYIFVLALVKHSILLFYRRVFGPTWINHIATAFTVIWTIGSFISVLCSPVPISYFWTEVEDPDSGHWRFDFNKYYVGNAAGNIITDFVVLLVPAWTIWNLKMRISQKIMVSAVLLLGALYVCSFTKLKTCANEN